MKIVFFGSGNVATHMAVALKGAGYDIIQVYSRTRENALRLACRVDAKPICNMKDLDREADLYLFSVKDDALSELISQMPCTSGVWAHTAGSVPVSVFSRQEKSGVIYPLQTFSRERKVDFSNVPLFVEGVDDATQTWLKEVAERISRNVQILSGEKRRMLHLAAVFACNYTNHMYTLASEILRKNEIPFHVLHPLISETAAKAMMMDPKVAQTGPAVRHDKQVIQDQLALLDDPIMKKIYVLLSQSIYKMSE